MPHGCETSYALRGVSPASQLATSIQAPAELLDDLPQVVDVLRHAFSAQTATRLLSRFCKTIAA